MSVNLIPILSKVKSYSGELIDPLAKIVCKVIYKRQLHHHSFIIVDSKKLNLSGRDMLCVIKTNWSNYLCKSWVLNKTNLLDSILEKYSEVFNSELGKMKDVLVKLLLPFETKPIFYKARPVPYAIKEKVENELGSSVKKGTFEPWGL